VPLVLSIPGLPQPHLSLRHIYGLLLAVFALTLPVAITAAGVEPSLSRFNRVALAVSKEAQPLRADFALTAISEMTAAYTAEAERARQDARRSKHPKELVRWAGAVDTYAAELAAVGESLTPETAVDVSIGHDNSVYLNIAGTPVVVGTPRAQEQSEFEQRIIERFCAAYRCDEFVADLEPVPAPERVRGQPPSWSFSQYSGPACSTADGLELQFRTMQDLGRKREVCTRLVAELNQLSVAIGMQTGIGVSIDWNRLEIRGDPNAEQQQIVLNGRGDMLQLAVPGLAAVPDFLRQSLPWVAARVKGESYRLVLLNADTLVAPLLYPGSSSN
jgi:hypothetical protein